MFAKFIYLASFFLTFSIAQGQDRSEVTQQSTATYSLVYTSTWSADTHPDNFPINAHYSGLKGATHNSSVKFWEAGSLASAGIQLMAETGNNSTLDAEMDIEAANGNVQFIINGPGQGMSPGTASVTFDISTSHPLFTIVAMIAPSPDWFIGLNGVNLFDGTTWIDTLRVTAYTYDAGTDDGTTYGADDAPSNPHVDITRIEVSPFAYNTVVEPVGNFFFTLLSVLDTDAEPKSEFRVDGLYPNPFADRATLSISSDLPTDVSVELFDITGRKVQSLFHGTFSGTREIQVSGDGLGPGVYYYRVYSGNSVESGAAILVK